MKKQKQKQAINSDAYNYLKSLLHPNVRVLDLYVWGKWLKAELSSGINFSVRNTSTD